MGNLKGFSAIELLIVLGVSGILLVIVFSSFYGLKNTQALNSSVEEVTIFMDKARLQTLSSKNSVSHGIHFEAGRLVLFEGTSYDPASTTNSQLNIESNVEISTIALNGGGSDLIFDEFTGETDEYGSVTLRLKRDISQTRVIEIKPTGIISIQLH